MLVGEHRKIRKMEQDQDDELTVDRIVEWFKGRNAGDRQRLVRALSAFEHQKSGLA
jgi:hypothetical protein